MWPYSNTINYHIADVGYSLRGKNLICGWNAVSGQAQSPYVKGGIRPDDSFAGHSVSEGIVALTSEND